MIERETCEVVEIPVARYEKLIAAEKELELLKTAIMNCGTYDFDTVRKLFGIKKEEK